MKKRYTLSFLLFLSMYSFSQQATPSIQWSKCFGGTFADRGSSITQSTDGHFVIAGITLSNNGDAAGNTSDSGSVWVIKIDSSGNLLWQKNYGGTGEDGASFITA